MADPTGSALRHGAYQSKQRKIGMRLRPYLHGLDITTLQGSNEKHDQSGERSCSDQNIAFMDRGRNKA
jgi:hypothetical protein